MVVGLVDWSVGWLLIVDGCLLYVVCLYVCVYVCMHLYMYVFMFVCSFVYVFVCRLFVCC